MRVMITLEAGHLVGGTEAARAEEGAGMEAGWVVVTEAGWAVGTEAGWAAGIGVGWVVETEEGWVVETGVGWVVETEEVRILRDELGLVGPWRFLWDETGTSAGQAERRCGSGIVALLRSVV